MERVNTRQMLARKMRLGAAVKTTKQKRGALGLCRIIGGKYQCAVKDINKRYTVIIYSKDCKSGAEFFYSDASSAAEKLIDFCGYKHIKENRLHI